MRLGEAKSAMSLLRIDTSLDIQPSFQISLAISVHNLTGGHAVLRPSKRLTEILDAVEGEVG